MRETEQRRPMRPHGPHGPHGGPGMPGEKAKNFRGTISKLFRYIGNYKFAVILVCLFAMGSTVFSVVGPKTLGKATTELYNGIVAKYMGVGGIDFGAIGKILLTVLMIYAASALCSFVQHFTMTTVVQNVCYRMRREITEKIGRMPMK